MAWVRGDKWRGCQFHSFFWDPSWAVLSLARQPSVLVFLESVREIWVEHTILRLRSLHSRRCLMPQGLLTCSCLLPGKLIRHYEIAWSVQALRQAELGDGILLPRLQMTTRVATRGDARSKGMGIAMVLYCRGFAQVLEWSNGIIQCQVFAWMQSQNRSNLQLRWQMHPQRTNACCGIYSSVSWNCAEGTGTDWDSVAQSRVLSSRPAALRLWRYKFH